MYSLLLNQWSWNPGIAASLVLLAASYALTIVRFRPRTIWDEHIVTGREIGSFVAAMILLIVAFISPVDTLNVHSLSIHMLQHVLLLFLVPPLLLIGIPGWALQPIVRPPIVGKTMRFLTSSAAAFMIFNGVLAFWSVPRLWDDALLDPRLHAIEHLTLFLAGLIAWWPIFSPVEEVPRMPHPVQIFYLFLQSLIPSLIGIALVFSTVVIYPLPVEVANPLGLSPLLDQRIAGLVLKLLGSAFLLVMVIIRTVQWFHQEEHEDEKIADDGDSYRLQTWIRSYPKRQSQRD